MISNEKVKEVSNAIIQGAKFSHSQVITARGLITLYREQNHPTWCECNVCYGVKQPEGWWKKLKDTVRELSGKEYLYNSEYLKVLAWIDNKYKREARKE